MNVSVKQAHVIIRIEENLGVEFLGTSSNEASAFISMYLEESKKTEEMDEVMSHIQYEEHGFI